MRPALALACAFVVAACSEPPPTTSETDCGKCDAHASCVAQADGAKKCVCDSGYAGDGRSCKAATDPAVCATCASDADCLLSQGATVCQCRDGFTGNGRYCTAELDPSQCGGCDARAVCERAPDGTPRCRCDAGLAGDGHSCHVPASCDDDHGGCHPFATCDASGGSIVCSCAFGTAGDGDTCLPPAGDVLRLQGDVDVHFTPAGGGQCVASWSLDIPLAFDGSRYTGTAHASVWDATATVTLTDPETGALHASVSLHAWEQMAPCDGDFTFSTGGDGESIPAALPLTLLGAPVAWRWTSSDGAAITDFSGGLSASFTR